MLWDLFQWPAVRHTIVNVTTNILIESVIWLTSSSVFTSLTRVA